VKTEQFSEQTLHVGVLLCGLALHRHYGKVISAASTSLVNEYSEVKEDLALGLYLSATLMRKGKQLM
jgi:hypothetical protein